MKTTRTRMQHGEGNIAKKDSICVHIRPLIIHTLSSRQLENAFIPSLLCA